MHQPNENSGLLGISTSHGAQQHGEVRSIQSSRRRSSPRRLTALSHHTHHKYGGDQKILDVEPDPKGRYCAGLIDPASGETVLAREKEERKATWLELFYDLIFVALVSQLTHALAGGPIDILRFSILYIFIWRTWSTTTMYSTRYDTNDLIHKWYYYFQMIAIVGMGIWLHPAYSEPYSVGFAASFLITRGLNFLMYLLAHIVDSSSGALPHLITTAAFCIPMIVSCFIPEISWIMWPISAFSEEIFNWARTLIGFVCCPRARVPISIEHLTERNGLFVMIVLGECVAGSMFRKSSAGEVIGVQFFVASALGLLIAFSLQWIYFDTEGRPKKTHALRRSIFAGIAWGFLHVPLVGFTIVGAAGLLQCMETVTEETFPTSAKWLMSCGFGAANMISSILGALSDEHPLRVRRVFTIPLRLLLSLIIILLPLMVSESFAGISYLAVVASLVFMGAIVSLVGGMPKPEPHFTGLNINSALTGLMKHA